MASLQKMLRLATLAGAMLCTAAAHGGVLRLVPTVTTTAAGTSFDLALTVSDVADLYSFDVSLTYNPGLVSFTSVTEGDFLSGAGTTFFVPGSDDGAGEIAFSGATLIGAIPGATGGGTLLRFHFDALSAGVAAFDFSDFLFVDSSFGEIAMDTVPASVTITAEPGGEVPVPGSMWLMALGGGMLWWSQAGRRLRG